jgi:hypothetical protein
MFATEKWQGASILVLQGQDICIIYPSKRHAAIKKSDNLAEKDRPQ